MIVNTLATITGGDGLLCLGIGMLATLCAAHSEKSDSSFLKWFFLFLAIAYIARSAALIYG